MQEIGIRMGASPRAVQIGMVLRTFALAALGLVLGWQRHDF